VTRTYDRRSWLARATWATAAAGAGGAARPGPRRAPKTADLLAAARDFLLRCRRQDGGYSPSPAPDYPGNSDTALSDLAAVTSAAVRARTFGWELPEPRRSADFVRRHQRADGGFTNQGGKQDPKSDLAVLYNTTQAVVALRALGRRPDADPAPAVARLVERGAYKKLPWYTTSFFPLFYAALGRPFPEAPRRALAEHQTRHQQEDGYLGDHVAATVHMAHYFRLIGRPTPRAKAMVVRVLRDQKADGGWDIKEPSWDVHACFDAVFILRQLGGDGEEVRAALARVAGWALGCRNADGGFGHFPGWHSDVDALYFQLGTLAQTGRVPMVEEDRADAHTLSWGHAMRPGRDYTTPGGPR